MPTVLSVMRARAHSTSLDVSTYSRVQPYLLHSLSVVIVITVLLLCRGFLGHISSTCLPCIIFVNSRHTMQRVTHLLFLIMVKIYRELRYRIVLVVQGHVFQRPSFESVPTISNESLEGCPPRPSGHGWLCARPRPPCSPLCNQLRASRVTGHSYPSRRKVRARPEQRDCYFTTAGWSRV